MQFQGRITSSPLVSLPALQGSDVAGVVPQAGWYPIDDAISFAPPEIGSVIPWDQDLNPTTVTFSFAGSDSWYNDTITNRCHERKRRPA